MKARDLAALAALGLGGAYLYNRNKGDATPKGADKPTAPADMNAGVGRRDASYAEDMNAGMGRRYAGDAEDMNAGMGRRGAGESDRGPVPNAMGVLDTEVYKRSEMDDLKGGRMPTRPGQSTSGPVARPAAKVQDNFGANESKYDNTPENIRAEKIMKRTGKFVPQTTQYLAQERNKRFPANTKMASGGKVSSASSRGDGIAQRGKTRGKMC